MGAEPFGQMAVPEAMPFLLKLTNSQIFMTIYSRECLKYFNVSNLIFFYFFRPLRNL